MGIIFAHCSQISRRTACHQRDYAPIISKFSTSPGTRKYLDLPTSRAQIFFYEREARAVEILCFLRQKRARKRASCGGQLPEPEMRSEGL